ncbi:MAG: 4a-hydroxytetrahydrobiopterin dehydratase, partial [Acidobacteriota bacterium]
MAPVKLTASQIDDQLAQLSGWTLQNEKIHKDFQFDDFVHAFG